MQQNRNWCKTSAAAAQKISKKLLLLPGRSGVGIPSCHSCQLQAAVETNSFASILNAKQRRLAEQHICMPYLRSSGIYQKLASSSRKQAVWWWILTYCCCYRSTSWLPQSKSTHKKILLKSFYDKDVHWRNPRKNLLNKARSASKIAQWKYVSERFSIPNDPY